MYDFCIYAYMQPLERTYGIFFCLLQNIYIIHFTSTMYIVCIQFFKYIVLNMEKY